MHQILCPSPVGPLLLASDGEALCLIEFEHPRHPFRRSGDWQECEDDVLRATRRQLDEYFDGTRHGFTLPLAPRGTGFQQQVWLALREIPYGQTISYAQLAQRLEMP